MELSKLKDEVLNIFEIKDISELKNALIEVTLNNKFEYYRKFKELVKDLNVDWLQMIYQYYQADREKNKQDFTPLSLAKLVSKLSENEEEVIDMCSGSGALVIQKWSTNNNLKFICKELDENVIPYLLFNLAVRNINAKVYHMDVLQDETFHIYMVKSEDEFSKIEEIK